MGCLVSQGHILFHTLLSSSSVIPGTRRVRQLECFHPASTQPLQRYGQHWINDDRSAVQKRVLRVRPLLEHKPGWRAYYSEWQSTSTMVSSESIKLDPMCCRDLAHPFQEACRSACTQYLLTLLSQLMPVSVSSGLPNRHGYVKGSRSSAESISISPQVTGPTGKKKERPTV